jgi:hypothetical protein
VDPRGGVVGPLGGGASFCVRDICILNAILTQHKTYILVRTLLGYALYLPLSTGTGSQL